MYFFHSAEFSFSSSIDRIIKNNNDFENNLKIKVYKIY